jgi:hemoglobin
VQSRASTVTAVNALFDRVDGEQFFVDLVDHFYLGVAGDPLLRPLYPEDLTESRQHLALFLMQYWGGPSTYNDQRGHPRLRMRHVPFVIGPAERDAWLRHMNDAVERMVETAGLTRGDADEFRAYFEMAAGSLMNAP